jgi:predicted DNA-binding transcriptional regulator AlpA
MGHTSTHIEELRDEIRAAGEDAKRMVDHIIRAACLLFADRDRAGELGDVNTSVETSLVPIWIDKPELSVIELANRWGVSPRSIYQWRLTRGLPYRKIGRLLRFDWIEADAWSKRHHETFTKARLRIVR